MAPRSFARPASSVATPAKKTSRWDGLDGGFTRPPPMPEVGEYRLRFVSGEQKPENPRTGNASTHFLFEIVELDDQAAQHHKSGDTVDIFFITSGKARQAGMNRVFSLMTACAGFSDVEDYRAFDPDGECYDASCGEANSYSADGRTVIGRLVDVRVDRGKPSADGGYYREYSLTPVAEDEQEQP